EPPAEAASGPDEPLGRQSLEDLRQERLRDRRRARDVSDEGRVVVSTARQVQDALDAVLHALGQLHEITRSPVRGIILVTDVKGVVKTCGKKNSRSVPAA